MITHKSGKANTNADAPSRNPSATVPESLHPTILQEAHSSCFAGHFAFKKVYDRLRVIGGKE